MSKLTTTLRTTGIIAVIVLVFAVIFASLTHAPAAREQVWDEATTVGNLDAKNHYVMYTDLMCPYCDVFSRAVMDHWDEFLAYLDEHDILFEIRLTDMLYEGNDIDYSRDAAEAAFCATRAGRFWDYYHAALAALWDDYHSKGIGNSKTADPITDMPDDYWLEIGSEIGLGDDFTNCVTNHESVADIEENTLRASRSAQGLPSFQFNDFVTSGFGETWGWDYVLMYLDAGL